MQTETPAAYAVLLAHRRSGNQFNRLPEELLRLIIEKVLEHRPDIWSYIIDITSTKDTNAINLFWKVNSSIRSNLIRIYFRNGLVGRSASDETGLFAWQVV